MRRSRSTAKLAPRAMGWSDEHFDSLKRRHAAFDPAIQRAVLTLGTTAQRVENAVAGWLASGDLTPQKFSVLLLLYAEGKPVALSTLRRYLMTTQANVTGLAGGLESDGLVERTTSERDARVSLLRLSRQGKRAIAAHLNEYLARSRNAARTLSPSERRQLTALLDRLASGYEAA